MEDHGLVLLSFKAATSLMLFPNNYVTLFYVVSQILMLSDERKKKALLQACLLCNSAT